MAVRESGANDPLRTSHASIWSPESRNASRRQVDFRYRPKAEPNTSGLEAQKRMFRQRLLVSFCVEFWPARVDPLPVEVMRAIGRRCLLP